MSRQISVRDSKYIIAFDPLTGHVVPRVRSAKFSVKMAYTGHYNASFTGHTNILET